MSCAGRFQSNLSAAFCFCRAVPSSLRVCLANFSRVSGTVKCI